jgi:A/G-specific adenine glycosylase
MQQIIATFLSWYEASARDLPWRRTSDPYAIWVSEIMLQQTQVKTVIPYYHRWLRRFPTIRSLAEAEPGEVLKLWEGMGYYSRARNLQRAAQEIVQNHNGKFPERYEKVLELPGIGRYTAGAICSIAFNQPTPILDGNVIRVLARVNAIRENCKEAKTVARLWKLSAQLVEIAHLTERRDACSHLNQGLMELGATICLPRNPRCEACPLAEVCRAGKRGIQERLPNLGKRPTGTKVTSVALILRRSSKFLVKQRKSEEVNGGFWEFPNFELQQQTDLSSRAGELGFSLSHGAAVLAEARHTIMNRRIELRAYGANLGSFLPEGYYWKTVEELAAIPLFTGHRKLLKKLAA